jgi:hypothetical protein
MFILFFRYLASLRSARLQAANAAAAVASKAGEIAAAKSPLTAR